MKDLSLHILDIAENAVRAGAALTDIRIDETADTLTLTVADDGCGMEADTVRRVTDPFFTTRKTRSVGMGLPLLKQAAEQTGGRVTVTSRPAEAGSRKHGTVITAVFCTGHIDCPPLGDPAETLVTLLQGHPDLDFRLCHRRPDAPPVKLDTRVLRRLLTGVPLSRFEVLQWVRNELRLQYAASGRE